MSSKVERAAHGPGWAEVILGAVLSALLGVVLGAVLLILKPVSQVKELPKPEERVRGAVYYVEGAKDANKAKQALAKRKAFVEGQSVSVTEEEINSLVAGAAAAPAPAPAAPKGGKAGDKKAEGAADSPLATGTPNFRIREGKLQIAVPVNVSVAGIGEKVLVQARGGLAKDGEIFVFQPEELYLGSCPVQRLPFLASYVRSKFSEAQQIPEDIATAWRKLASVSIEDKTLKLTMP